MTGRRRLIIMLCVVSIGVTSRAFAYESRILNFDVQPRTLGTSTADRSVDISLVVSVYGSELERYCGGKKDFKWYVYEDISWGQDTLIQSASGSTPLSTATRFDLSFKTTVPPRTTDSERHFYATLNCPPGLTRGEELGRSAAIPVSQQGASGTEYACVADNGIYACSPGHRSDLSDVPACAAKQPTSIPAELCGTRASTGTDSSTPSSTSGPAMTSMDFSIKNPIKSQSLLELIDAVAGWILTLAIPASVIMIVYSGLTYLTSGGNPGKVQKAKQILTYAIIGLAVIMIGRGFVSLIQSILDLA